MFKFIDFYYCLVLYFFVNFSLIKFWGLFFGLEYIVYVNKRIFVIF